MRIRSGIDIVEVSRMLKYADAWDGPFCRRCFTEAEASYCQNKSPQLTAERMAARFAAKEAVAKAFGTGIFAEDIGMTDIEILKDEAGAPYVVFHGAASKKAEELKVISVSVSLSHEKGYAVANCSMLTDEKE